MANITKPNGLSNIWANGGTKIDPGAAKVNIGWVVQLPPYEYQNWVDNRQDQAIAHISQHGVPEWDAGTEYQGLLSYTQGSDGIIYKCLQTNTNKDPSNTLNSLYWAVAFESYGSVAALQAQLNAHITNYQTLSGVGNPAAARANLSIYSKAESDTRFASLNGSSTQVFSVGVATQPEHAVRLGQVASLLTQATEANLGVVRLATIGATEAGVDDLTAVTPAKGQAVYLKKSGNLAGLASVSQARTNLGLGTMATQNVGAFLQAASNLSDVVDKAIARANLGLTSTATQPETYFLRVANNLGDVASVSVARTNLGLTSTAVTPIGSLLQAANNLGELTSAATARANLGLADTATIGSGNFMFRANNLGDLTNVQAARNNLGLGPAATMAVQGPVSFLNFNASLGSPGWSRLPNGLLMQWGFTPPVSDTSGLVSINFPVAFSQIFSFTANETNQNGVGAVEILYAGNSVSNTGFTFYPLRRTGNNSGGVDTMQVGWFAIGV
jgi:hypothetical protein